MGRVLVTGATGGIGSAVVRALRAGGHEVVALGRDPGPLSGLAAHGVHTLIADLSKPARLEGALTGLGELDALVHCAGVSEVAEVAGTAVSTWDRTLTVNVTAAAEVTRLALPGLRRRAGHVVFVNAAPGMRGVPRWSAYVGSKAALRELADSLRDEESAHGVRVTTVLPGGTATELLRRTRESFGREYDPGRTIRPESLADMIVWVLAAPPDAYPAELSVLPAPRS
ncbi:MAG: SDR family oxidoreductase [Streptosporangiales bacterium]|nr:SDR family oxidoreductase [Streptosporangiales bacterium]